jgi:outer membrane immunogenic protein
VALDYTAGAIEASPTTNPGVYNCGGCNTTVENSFALRGRIGRAMDRTLVYVTAGFAGGDATAWSPGPLIHGSDSLSGWVAGFGVERAVTNRLSIFAEYLHTDLGRLEIPTACSINCFTDVSYGTLRIGGNLRW